MNEQPETHHPIDRWLPWFIVGFFLLLFLVLGDMVRVALGGFQGVVTDNAYQAGLAYDRELDARTRQERSGMTAMVTVENGARGAAHVHVTVQDAAGEVIPLLRGRVRFIRPTTGGMDRQSVLRPAGVALAAVVALPAPGLWDVVVTTEADGVPLQFVRRVVL